MDPPHRRHRRVVSTPRTILIQSTPIHQTPSTRHVSSPASPDHPRPPRAASRIMTSVKRSLTPSSKFRTQDRIPSRSGIYSTPEERMPPQSHFMTSDDRGVGSAPPTIEQIAMGLHVSRTPHLRPLGPPRHPYSRGTTAPAVALPPPPARSSMKKPSQSRSSPAKNSDSLSSESNSHLKPFGASSTTVTSVLTAPSSARSSGAFSFPKFRLGRFLPGSRSSSAPSSSILSTPVSSPRNSNSEFEIVQKKAVRFEEADD